MLKFLKNLTGERQIEISRVRSFLKGRFFALLCVIFVSGYLISVNGSASTYGQNESYVNTVKKYINELATSAIILNKAQSAEINNAASFVGLEKNETPLSPINTLQQTALLAFNSLENDFSEFKSLGKNGQIAVYTVQDGDTLSFIASDFGVNVNTIIWANNLKDVNSIRPGDELKIPSVNGVIHKVKRGDTVISVAKKYSADEEKIIEFNALSQDGTLQVDEEIIVPDGKMSPPAVATSYGKTIVKRFAYLPDLDDFFLIPTTGRNWGIVHGRNGVDIANSCGTPIYAAADSVAAIVDSTGWNGGFGKFIKLVHPNGTETIYAHTSKILINQGESVAKGQEIALMGTTGNSTGCHLHFEVHGARNPLGKY